MSFSRNLQLGAIVAIVCLAFPLVRAENVDPGNNGSQYAYSENAGWLNAEPLGDGGPGVQVGDVELSGWMWAENVGWISFHCDTTGSCADTAYGVTNDGSGNLAGYAWSENAGWLSFSCVNTMSCGAASYGVTIDPASGDFSGRAWGENIGWISFASTGAHPYRLSSGWICSPSPSAPSGHPALSLAKEAGSVVVSWGLVAGATGADIVGGDLAALRSGGGDFSTATAQCLDDDRTTTSLEESSGLPPGQGTWYLVRGQNCGGSGSYDSGSPPQAGSRDAEITLSGNDCS